MTTPPSEEPELLEYKDAAPAAHPDAGLWIIWMGLVLIAVAVLPFLVRHYDWAQAIADACLSLVRG